MIQHLDRVGKTVAALSLLSDHTYRTTINGNIKISIGPSAVEEFSSEEEFMIWMLSQIKATAERELGWFRKKYPLAYEVTRLQKGLEIQKVETE
jgi:hypothetical protein